MRMMVAGGWGFGCFLLTIRESDSSVKGNYFVDLFNWHDLHKYSE